MTKQEEDCVRFVVSDIRFRERLFQIWGLTYDQALECILTGYREWADSEPLEVSPSGFVGAAGYTKEDEL